MAGDALSAAPLLALEGLGVVFATRAGPLAVLAAAESARAGACHVPD